jgi:hypothetical protein
MPEAWLGRLLCGLLLYVFAASADYIHPERGEVLHRVKRSLQELGKENQVIFSIDEKPEIEFTKVSKSKD